ncbi:hypothetical protein XENTR_v10010799 [Xenopus tropicalis]|nr:hypothetical protein XENTR_v10010799 [Xenopus tropicalis]
MCGLCGTFRPRKNAAEKKTRRTQIANIRKKFVNFRTCEHPMFAGEQFATSLFSSHINAIPTVSLCDIYTLSQNPHYYIELI